nr:hypothetical protein [uncultured Flavobacterium sp.]
MKNPQKTIGYILIFPPVLSVLLFTVNLLFSNCGNLFSMYNLSSNWTGYVGFSNNGDGGGGGYMSATPVYFGLMAIAGAYLIKNSKE